MENEEAGTAAAGPATKEREFRGTDDLISCLPDDILGSIITLLPTKDGGRTQALSRRWRNLWRSAPLNLEVRTFFSSGVAPSAVSKIIAEHPGPARRFYLPRVRTGDDDLSSELESWFRSRALANLQELDIRCAQASSSYPLLQSVLRSSSTLRFISISYMDFPDQIMPSMTMSFPLLKQLSLIDLSISGGVFHGLLSACRVLESLFVSEVRVAGCLHVSSSTLRIITLQTNLHGRTTELVIEDTPRLERLLLPGTHGFSCRLHIRIMRAPKLEILGPFTADFSRLQFFQGLSPLSLANSMHSVKVLAVGSSSSQLIAVLSVLSWFPCLKKLYVSLYDNYWIYKKNVPQYDPLHPVECLQTHLKKVVLQKYSGYGREADFARFLVLNAKVLNKIEFQQYGSYNSEIVAYLQMMLQVENKASQDLQFEFSTFDVFPDYHLKKHIHDSSGSDPFRQP